MSAFIVSGGSLLEVGCPSTLSRETAQQVGFTTTLGGKRKAFIRKGGRRAWNVDVSAARPGDVSTLEAVARGVGPYGWYPPEAAVGNLLSPQASGFEAALAAATPAGLVQLPDGSVASTVAHSGGGNVSPGGGERIPIRPGERVSVGVWALGGIRFEGWWRDAQGATQTAWSNTVETFTGWQWREHTLTPPASARFLSLSLNSGVQYARPVVSWGSTAHNETGTGCPQAIIHSPSHAPIALWAGANYTNSSYQVTEVG